MDANLKAKWIEALRSGEYVQTRDGYFEDNGRFCCLGVLCVVADKPPLVDPDMGGNWNFVDHELGLSHVSWRLATMNDEGTTFPQIADYIEANL